MKKKLLVSEEISPNLINKLSPFFVVDYNPKIERKELLSKISDYNVIVVRSKTKVDPEVINKGKNLELICRAGTGVDNIDIEAATRKGIPVMNTPGGNTISAAEHTLALMLALCRHIPQANISLRENKWERSKFKGTELQGKTLGIIGLGKIGKEVASRAKSFGMKIVGFDPLLSKEIADQLEIELYSFKDLISNSDIITLHVPLTEDTENLISEKTIDKCKDGIKIINCARGGLVNENAVVAGLNKEKISGAAFDVFLEEPPKNSELINHPKVICTPHLGASTEEAQEKIAVQLGDQIISWLNENKLDGCVNTVGIKHIGDEKVQPYLDLAERIGEIHFQILRGNCSKVVLNYHGNFLEKYSETVKAAYLKGLIQNLISQPVNYINVFAVAAEIGLMIEEKYSPPDKIYPVLFSADMTTTGMKSESNLLIAGTVAMNNYPVITNIGEYHAEIKPEGNMILYYNHDRPGVLSKVSSILAGFSINIAGLSLSRLGKGLDALTVINTDEVVNKKILDELKEIDEIKSIYSLRISTKKTIF